jgi:hypothetical protein
MSWKGASWTAIVVLAVAGCDSGKSESEQEREGATGPAAAAVREFYDAANDSAGEKACALLTTRGVRTVARVKSRQECVRTINGLTPGSFESDEDELVDIEGVEEAGDGFDVEAVVKGRSEGAFSVVEQNGKLLIDGFTSDEG